MSADALKKLITSGDYVLFLGAGVSVEAGLKPWKASLDMLADRMPPGAEHLAHAMKTEAEKRRFLEAAELFYLADMSEQERAVILNAAFQGEPTVTARMKRLARSNYAAIVSTNYDRAMLKAATDAQVALISFGEGDADLQAARACDERFFVRMHGRIEVPSSIVLAKRHYAKLAGNEAYISFFRWVFEFCNVVFFGFSFDDPFLRALIEASSRAAGGRFKRSAFALFSSPPTDGLAQCLTHACVTPVIYSPANGHDEGWALVSEPLVGTPTPQVHVEDAVQRQLASVIVGLRLREESSTRTAVLAALALGPLRQIVAKGPVEIGDALESTRRELGLRSSQLGALRKAVGHLADTKQIQMDGDRLVRADAPPSGRSKDLSVLTRSVLARAVTRFKVDVREIEQRPEVIEEVLTRTLVADGLVIAHGLMKRSPLEKRRLELLVDRSIVAMPTAVRKMIQPVRDAVLHLLHNPDRDEEALLDGLASVAFTTSILIADPALLEQAENLVSRTTFLDTSILLPWICDGHPTQTIANQIVDGLSGHRSCVAEFYLNELVQHRNLALQAYKEGRLDDRSRFEAFVRLHGLHRINAYLGGFGGRVGAGYGGSFEKYLSETAPYTNEREARDFLARRGVHVVDERDLVAKEDNVPLAKGVIKDGLQKQKKPPREDVRLSHDAKMICYLHRLKRSSVAPIFITADKAFLRCLPGTEFAHALEQILLPHQGLYLAELAETRHGKVSGLSRMLWSVRPDKLSSLRNFYTDRVLREYESALIEDVENIVDAIVDEIEKIERAFGSVEFDEDSTLEAVKQFTALDRFEPKFYELMLAAKKKHGLG